MTRRERYQPGPTDVAALSLGGDSDDENELRREAVRACLSHLEDAQGELVAVPAPTLREIGWSVDSETTADPMEQWGDYLGPALRGMDQVDELSAGRFRRVVPSERKESSRLASSPSTEAGTTDVAALAEAETDAERANIEATARLLDMSPDEVRRRRANDDDRDPNAPGKSFADTDSDHDRNRDAALASGTIDGGPSPSQTPSQNDDKGLSFGERVERGDAGSQARIERRARQRAARNADHDATLSAESETPSGPTCARCGDPANHPVDAPALDARFDTDDRLCSGCFQQVALGQERRDVHGR